MGDAIPHAGTDKCQMRIAVAGLDNLLRVRQFGPQVHLVVTVCSPFREQGTERTKELRQQVVAVMHPQGKTSVEIARRGMWRTEKGPLIPAQDVTRFVDPRGNVKSLKAALWRQREFQFGRA